MSDPAGRVSLREPRPEDAAALAALPREAEIVRMYGGTLTGGPERTLANAEEEIRRLTEAPFGRIICLDDRAVGGVRLHSLNSQDRRARLAIGLFASGDTGRGIGQQAIRLTLDHAFGPMDLHRVDLRVLAFNERAIRCYLACGFVHEGTEREAALIDGTWHDDLIMGILRAEHLARG
ncbi:GNAT family N-acetyltransferase [Wenxinia marina]|uniref:Acetyltransferase n=1 Tax=Wenxinia marina DSM 24838 TaxID=1123501 RepID=A0A0D0Q806_9RHOB|nr:GNAT family protein [Wenxinia marina]KIQ70569.1 Acetyltransferase [Wenxinia marina DSM 24838]GGL52084.1 hypothetical protein GCM10011392_03030 [Wenxinia marina]